MVERDQETVAKSGIIGHAFGDSSIFSNFGIASTLYECAPVGSSVAGGKVQTVHTLSHAFNAERVR